MSSTDIGLRFWLRYVEASGGLTDDAGDSALVVLPSRLQALHELPEELVVTGDPDVAREDGATFLAAGHPVLGQAAEDVLVGGDVARVTIPVPPTLPPASATLVASARDQFPVDHGRIDATAAPTRAVRAVLRVGALVSYTLSTDDHYQERVECWIDATSLRELPEALSAKLASLPAVVSNEAGDQRLLPSAINEAHRLIDAGAQRRRACLSGDASQALAAELERVEAYYRDVLATNAKRRRSAPADRWKLLDAQADSTRTERARRIAETREKYQAAHQIKPYRLRVYDLPVWRLPVDVRRGDRRYSLTLDWLVPLSRFADLRCPHCGAPEPLVAGKTRLGCTACLVKPAVELTRAPTTESRPPVRPTKQRPPVLVRPVAPRQTTVGARTAWPPAKIVKAGDKLSWKLWDAVVNRDRRASRLCAHDSPAAAAVRLYGPTAAAQAIGIPTAEIPVASAAQTTPAACDALQATRGFVEMTAGQRFPFLLWWRMIDNVALIEEIVPFDMAHSPARLPLWVFGPGRSALLTPPQPRIPLGPVGELLWQRALPEHGLSVVLRCVAAWWRVSGESALTAAHCPSALAAGLERMICQRAGASGRYADVAARYRVDEQAVRRSGADLQDLLKLSPAKLW